MLDCEIQDKHSLCACVCASVLFFNEAVMCDVIRFNEMDTQMELLNRE